MEPLFKILLLILFTCSFHAFGQKIQTASFEYHHSTLPSSIKYSEVYSISNFKIEHYSSSNKSGKYKKKRLKKSAYFTQAVSFLDSILSAEYYIIEWDPVQLQNLLKDSVTLKRWEITPDDIRLCFDSQNRIRFERTFFHRNFDLPSYEKQQNNDSVPVKIRIKFYQLEGLVIDGTPFQLDFSVNGESRFSYSSNLFASPSRSKYAEWFSMYLMQKQFQLFERRSPITYYFGAEPLNQMVIMYVVWKKYGVS